MNKIININKLYKQIYDLEELLCYYEKKGDEVQIQILKGEIGQVKNIISLTTDVPTEAPIHVTPKEVAQWVIDNRYSKNEHEKIGDAEMYHTIIEKIN